VHAHVRKIKGVINLELHSSGAIKCVRMCVYIQESVRVVCVCVYACVGGPLLIENLTVEGPCI
jgi:hypothetical protein